MMENERRIYIWLPGYFAEFDRIAPARDHASDGAVGDLAHQQEVSDHNPDETGSVPIHDADTVNEVHAIDVDNTLNESDLTMEKVVQFLLVRCRSGAEKRLRYVIYNRRIWSASSGWVQKTYTGSSPHTEHAHFSGSYDTKLEASTASWHLEDIPVALTWLPRSVTRRVRRGRSATTSGTSPSCVALSCCLRPTSRRTSSSRPGLHWTGSPGPPTSSWPPRLLSSQEIRGT
jgi:hypothetical protein